MQGDEDAYALRDERFGQRRDQPTISDQVLKQGVGVDLGRAAGPPVPGTPSIVLGGLRSVMAVPLAVEGRISGMIYVDNSVPHQPIHPARPATADPDRRRRRDPHRERPPARSPTRAEAVGQRAGPRQRNSIQAAPRNAARDPRLRRARRQLRYEVGGDYYDFIEKPDGRHAIALGDVSGKELARPCWMSSIHAAVRAHTRTRLSASEIVSEINQYIYDNTPANRYVTLFTANSTCAPTS